jgi:hypothetical protein
MCHRVNVIAVIFCETSNQQSGSSMNLGRRESSGNTARIAALLADHALTAIIG